MEDVIDLARFKKKQSAYTYRNILYRLLTQYVD